MSTACITTSPPLQYPCYWDVEVREQDFGPELSKIVSVSGSVEECVPQFIPPDLQAGDWVEVYGEIISMRDSAWVCQADYYLRRISRP